MAASRRGGRHLSVWCPAPRSHLVSEGEVELGVEGIDLVHLRLGVRAAQREIERTGPSEGCQSADRWHETRGSIAGCLPRRDEIADDEFVRPDELD